MYGPAGPYVPLAGAKDLGQLAQYAAGQNNPVLHLHWDDRMFGRDDEPDANQTHAQTLVNHLTAFKHAGGKIFWTIHNKRAHFERDAETFAWGRGQLCALADLVHVHALHAARHMIEDWGVAPEKIRIIRHPSYLGAYEPAEVTLARPLPPSPTRRFVFFGTMRGNKGIALLPEAIARLAKHRPDFDLLIAGKTMRRAMRRMQPMIDLPQVSVRDGFIPDADVPAIFAAGQVFLAPFGDFFTSGSVMLAQTFGLPVIGPDREEMRAITPPANHDLLYDGQRPKPLVQMMKRLIDMPDDELQERREICLQFAVQTRSERICEAFTQTMRSLQS
ncbi:MULTISPECIES: glycosyltransferase family 4 protein [unclassified Yoonia]|uniref:glycosyltransferase family 4 protein n=1 Tax=unclassified Yoonia TaxID=2629118 RepID=UPI002B003699|nr:MULTISPECIES: glycosyltransferase family 4 protein [unclassified Yoonia]